MAPAAPDKVDEAIAAAEAKPTVEMAQAQIRIMGREDRPAIIAMPKDVTDMELIALMVSVAQFGDQLRAQRPSARIIIPGGVIQ
jgi:hypothetical protein